MLVILTSDLMMASKANSLGREHEIKITQTTTIAKAKEAILEFRPHVFLVDLQTPNLDILELGKAISDLPDAVAPLTIAYAQHVEVDRLESANQVGFDQVLTRGQLNSQLGRIVADAK